MCVCVCACVITCLVLNKYFKNENFESFDTNSNVSAFNLSRFFSKNPNDCVRARMYVCACVYVCVLCH